MMKSDVFAIRNVSILHGDDLEYVKKSTVVIENGFIKKIFDLSVEKDEFKGRFVDLERHIAIPCFIDFRTEPNSVGVGSTLPADLVREVYKNEAILLSKRSGILHTHFYKESDLEKNPVLTSISQEKFRICSSFSDDPPGVFSILAISKRTSGDTNLWSLLKLAAVELLQDSGKNNTKRLRNILKSVTVNPSKLLGMRVGRIEEGSPASFQVLRLPAHPEGWDACAVFKHVLIDGSSSITHILEEGSFLAEYNSDRASGAMGCDGDAAFGTVEDAVSEFKLGKYVIVIDEESRENEGDLVIAAEDMTEEKFLFMLKNTGGVVCVPMDKAYLDRLGLDQMILKNNDRFNTAFTVSCDLIENTTSGISLRDRVLTIKRLADEDATSSEFSRPGHVFPLRPHPSGILGRRGHTESSWELCRLANKKMAAAISEIVDETGNTMRLAACLQFAKKHNIVAISTNALYAYVKNM